MEKTLEVGHYVKLISRDDSDRRDGLYMGEIGRVVEDEESGSVRVDFGLSTPRRFMMTDQLERVSAAPFANIGDTVWVEGSEFDHTGPLVVRDVDNQVADYRLDVKTPDGSAWVKNDLVTKIVKRADKAAPAPDKTAKAEPFVVGEWVRVSGPHANDIPSVGQVVASPTNLGYDLDCVTVEFAGWTGGHDGHAAYNTGVKSRWIVRAKDLTRTEAPMAIVGVSPKPSVFVASGEFIIIGDMGAALNPFRHSTMAAAEKEARRLSAKFHGQNFTVYAKAAQAYTPKAATSFSMVA